MHKIKIKLNTFAAAHRLDYPSKCQFLHGHNYTTTATVASEFLDENCFVAEFSKIKKLFNSWLDEYIDHRILIGGNDQELLTFAKNAQQPYFLLPKKTQSTVEKIAAHIFSEFKKIISNNYQANVRLIEITIWENEDSAGIYAEE